MRHLLLFIVLVSCPLVFGAEKGYYWRDYNERIPEDAFIGGQTPQGNNIYIGQAYVQDHGIIPVEILNGETTTNALDDESFPVDAATTSIKILCGNEKRFAWVPTTAASLEGVIKSRETIRGGQQKEGFLLIGRQSFKNSTHIGKILSHKGHDGIMYFLHEGEQLYMNYFDVLVTGNAESSSGRANTR